VKIAKRYVELRLLLFERVEVEVLVFSMLKAEGEEGKQKSD